MPHKRFFSVIVPAHNEASVIEKTLGCLRDFAYPGDRYEIIVVENGSTDATYEKAKKFESRNCRILRSPKGVSRARNFGFNSAAPEMEWCLFLDADTFLGKNFLSELNDYLEKHPRVDYGTTTVHLDDTTVAGAFWSWYLNATDKLIRIMHRVHIVRAELARRVVYDENLVLSEDLRYSRDLSKFGNYFFMKTDSVVTSARRFKSKGYVKMFFVNMITGLFPKKVLTKKDWEVIR